MVNHDTTSVAQPPSGQGTAQSTRAFVAALCALMALRAALSVLLWRDAGGYFWLTGDDAARTQLAYTWSVQPYFNIGGNVWLPLGIWLHGAALKVVLDPLAVSAAVNTAFSTATMFFIYRIADVLFRDRPATAVIAAALAGFCPLVIWLGLSGLSEPIFHFFLLAGIWAWLLAHRDDQPRLYVAAAVGLLGASMVRLEAWLLVGLFGLYCAWRSWRHERRWALLASAALAGSFIPAWLFWHWQQFGNPFSFVLVPQAANAGGLAAADFTSFVSLLWDNSPLAFALAPVGVFLALRRTAGGTDVTRRPYLILVSAFVACFALATRGRLASNTPVRNLTALFLMLAPFAAYAVATMGARVARPRMLALIGAAGLAAVGAVQAFDYQFQAGDATVRAAIWIRHVTNSGVLDAGADKVLIEARRGGAAERLIVFDSLFLHAVNPRYTVYDRRPRLTPTADTWVINTRNNPSLLEGSAADVRDRLRTRGVRFVVAYSANVRQVLGAIMVPVETGAPVETPFDYAVYRWPDERQVADATQRRQ